MKNRNLIVGLFVIGGLALFTIGLFLIGNQNEAFARNVEFYTEFVNVSGLTKGAKVRVSGMDAGEVLDIGVPPGPESRFRIKFRIRKNLSGLVRTDSVASIETEGVVGNILMTVHPGSKQAQAAPALTTLPSKEPFELADLLEEGRGLIKDTDGTIRLVGPEIKTTLNTVTGTVSHVNTTVSHVDDIVLGLKQGRGTAGMLLRDEVLSAEVRQTVNNAKNATSGLNDATIKTNNLISDLQSRQLPQKADDTMLSARSAAANLDATSQKIRQTVTEMTGPDEQGVTAGSNLRESLTNVNTATGNMADETEALKHNFFFRGFFRKRGYYNLSQIAPDRYRSDKVFTNPSNRRAWIEGGDIFKRRQDGSEELTEQGRTLVDAAFVGFGDEADENPLIVEGYFDRGNAADQLIHSRARALLVRTYLQNHFQLKAANLGAVSLRNLPPVYTGRSTWDGVCIVLLRKSH